MFHPVEARAGVRNNPAQPQSVSLLRTLLHIYSLGQTLFWTFGCLNCSNNQTFITCYRNLSILHAENVDSSDGWRYFTDVIQTWLLFFVSFWKRLYCRVYNTFLFFEYRCIYVFVLILYTGLTQLHTTPTHLHVCSLHIYVCFWLPAIFVWQLCYSLPKPYTKVFINMRTRGAYMYILPSRRGEELKLALG